MKEVFLVAFEKLEHASISQTPISSQQNNLKNSFDLP